MMSCAKSHRSLRVVVTALTQCWDPSAEIWNRWGAVAARSPSMTASVVGWLRRPRAMLRTSFVWRSMATKQ
jgi:hypothetical protein